MRSYTRRWHKFAACLYAPLEAQKGPKKSSHYYISTRNPEVKLTQNLLQKKLGKSLMNATEQPYLIFHNDCYNVDLSEGSTMSMKWAIVWLLTLNGIQWSSYGQNHLCTCYSSSCITVPKSMDTSTELADESMPKAFKSHSHFLPGLQFSPWMNEGSNLAHLKGLLRWWTTDAGSCYCLVAESCLILLWPHGL